MRVTITLELQFSILNKERLVEGVLFIPANRPRRLPELVCADCGQLFRARWVADGAEELCDPCYEAQFRPPYFRNGRKPARNRPLSLAG